MAFVNGKGQSISFECTDLIEELKQDIKEFGGATVVAVWCKEYDGVVIYTNYDFIRDEQPLSKAEVKDGEFIKKMTMSALLIVLQEQNSII